VSTVLGPQDHAGQTHGGACVILLEPRGLEKHNLGKVLNLPSDEDVSLNGNDIARDGNVAEFVLGGALADIALVVTEDDLADELVRTKFDGGHVYGSFARGAKFPVVLPVDEVVL